jgi:hypothetical protein
MKKIILIILFFSKLLFAQSEGIEAENNLIEAKIIPNKIVKGETLDFITLSIQNNSKDSLLFTTGPYFLLDKVLCKKLLDCWFWSYKRYANIFFFEDEEEPFQSYSGDGYYKINFNSNVKFICVPPESDLELKFIIHDTINKYFANLNLNIFAFISYCNYNEVLKLINNDKLLIDKFKNSIIYYYGYYESELIPLVDLNFYNDKSSDSLIGTIIYKYFKYGFTVNKSKKTK